MQQGLSNSENNEKRENQSIDLTKLKLSSNGAQEETEAIQSVDLAKKKIVVSSDHPADYDSTVTVVEEELGKTNSQNENSNQQNQMSDEEREKVLKNIKRTEEDYEFNFDQNDRKLVISLPKNTIIVVAAEAVGKTSFVDHENMFGSNIVDETSLSEFMYKKNEDGTYVLDENGEKVREPEAFEKFMGHIHKTIEDGKIDILVLPLYRNLIKALDENEIPYVLVIPDTKDLAMQQEMRGRYKDREYSSEKKKEIEENWYLTESKTPNKIRLHPGEYLEDVVEKIKKVANE